MSTTNQILEKAIELALAFHKGQVKSDTGEPYILHCLRVMIKMETEEEMIAAVLHDTIEKSSLTLDDLIKQGFSSNVIEAIEAISKRKGEQYGDYINRLKSSPLAVKVKIADLEDNTDLRYVKANDQSSVEKLTRRKKYLKELREICHQQPE